MGINHKGNCYAAELGEVFLAASKNVCAAVAVSSLTCGGDYLDEAQERFAYEWRLLFQNGITPQPLPAKFKKLADSYARRMGDLDAAPLPEVSL